MGMSLPPSFRPSWRNRRLSSRIPMLVGFLLVWALITWVRECLFYQRLDSNWTQLEGLCVRLSGYKPVSLDSLNLLKGRVKLSRQSWLHWRLYRSHSAALRTLWWMYVPMQVCASVSQHLHFSLDLFFSGCFFFVFLSAL